MEKKKILIVEDDPDIAELIRLHLEDMNFQVMIAQDGIKGLQESLTGNYALIILDLMLPGLDGHEICKKLRQKDIDVPVLMLTLKSELVDKVLGLELGADDYMTKPFSIQELIARVKALLRRVQTGEKRDRGLSRKLVNIGALSIDLDKRKVSFGEKEIDLTPKQFDLLSFLAQSPGRPYNREELLVRVWGYETSGYEHTVDTHVNRLRSKIEPDPSNPQYLLTVWGVGYRFVEAHEIKSE